MNAIRSRIAIAVAALALLAPTGASADGFWRITGAGFGHGVGMSQYGAAGLARHGSGWRRILRHYYQGTSINPVPSQSVRVLLASGLPTASFSGVTVACGQELIETKTYAAVAVDKGIEVSNPAGKPLWICTGAIQAAGGESFALAGSGEYRGMLQLSSSGSGGLDAVDEVDIESYVRGVVPNESPSRWPAAALRAQAVAARSYALATRSDEGVFDLYQDTRSQVYGGVASETPSSDAASAKTAGLVVTYNGEIATTYFSSTSGGHTENVENVFGGPEVPYLRGVPDPYDAASPYHRWRERLSPAAMDAALAGLAKGSVREIRVTKTGASPRIREAEIVGSEGITEVDGSTLQSRLGLRDRWASFALVPSRRQARHAAVRLSRLVSGYW
ncbi:MAG: SpoIID/LytB domain-containing protein [Solirubrobacterales bacterium]